MKKYMVIGYDGEETFSCFFDTLDQAEDCRMNGAVSLGYMMQVYEWTEIKEDGLVMGHEYVMIYE